MDTNNPVNLFDLQVDHESTIYLRESTKWARFLAILGLVWCIFCILAGLSMMATRMKAYSGSGYSTGYTTGMSIAYMVFAVVNLFPCIYTLNFARKMKIALQNNDQEYLNASFKHLRSSFRYLGILAIVSIALLVTIVLFNLFG
jgi:uncharacterized membrane protein